MTSTACSTAMKLGNAVTACAGGVAPLGSERQKLHALDGEFEESSSRSVWM